MDVSVSGTIDQKMYLKNLGGFSPLSPPGSAYGPRKDTGLRELFWSISLNCQFMTKLETKHTLQAQGCHIKKRNGKQAMH